MEIGLQMEENLYMALIIIIQAFTTKQKALTGFFRCFLKCVTNCYSELRKSEGVTPVSRLKKRLKACCSSNPRA